MHTKGFRLNCHKTHAIAIRSEHIVRGLDVPITARGARYGGTTGCTGAIRWEAYADTIGSKAVASGLRILVVTRRTGLCGTTGDTEAVGGQHAHAMAHGIVGVVHAQAIAVVTGQAR